MSTFALPPLRLRLPHLRAIRPAMPAAQPTPEPVQHGAVLDEICKPVPASYRDLTIPGVVPTQQRSLLRRQTRFRGRAS